MYVMYDDDESRICMHAGPPGGGGKRQLCTNERLCSMYSPVLLQDPPELINTYKNGDKYITSESAAV